MDAIDFYIFLSTNFVSTFLSPQFDETFDVKAGEDQEACTRAQLSLGANPQPNINYHWQPANHLSDPTVANPAFLHADTLGQKADFQYIVEGKRGYCYGSDTVTVTIHPDKYAPLSGSKSVCPRITGVDYWAEADDRFRYEWSIEGGELVYGQHSASITVDWGTTNPAASVTLTPYNQLNCPSDPITFPVRINVELQTETPVGDELLCSNLATDIPFQITNTNGSIYTWESDAGNILQGQGTNKVRIDWPGDGKYHLWVKEQSTTIDTVCYGVSDSLLINLFTDSTKLEIDFAGVMRENSDEYELQWYASDTSMLAGNIEIFTSYDYSPDWQLKQAADRQTTYYTFADTSMNYAPVSFKISSVNGCREYIESEVHTTIFLEGMADSSSNSMKISWTPYLGWGNNIKQYEVWYGKDDDAQMSLVASMKPGQYSWSNHWGAEAFNHQYRIRAIHHTYPFESWSNQLTLSFDHGIEIPNVFTPNGDGINDTFSFPKLELFHENKLQVYDRNGSEVYSKQNYDGNWVGGDLASGVYYYSFTEKRNQKTYKGWVQILK
ncbi:MAG: gliding motility-associated C-terminal domain-containing protein [Cyclobacteriaceae bacterium]|nr:gliding motility-associated C-terminal domain-containing protein [Cyclobacteriaceae bacterium]